MDITPDISKRIRIAIKAKLGDLGACADDELLDYIMVMVANKKTKDQMTSDLQLFLGSSTPNFTEWLQALLEKLQAVREEARSKQAETEKQAHVAMKQKTSFLEDSANTKQKSDSKRVQSDSFSMGKKTPKDVPSSKIEQTLDAEQEQSKNVMSGENQKEISRVKQAEVGEKKFKNKRPHERERKEPLKVPKRHVSVPDESADAIQLEAENDEFAAEIAPVDNAKDDRNSYKREGRTDHKKPRSHRSHEEASRRDRDARVSRDRRHSSRDRNKRRKSRSPRERSDRRHREEETSRSSRSHRDERPARRTSDSSRRRDERYSRDERRNERRDYINNRKAEWGADVGDRELSLLPDESEDLEDTQKPSISSIVERPKRRELPPNLQANKSLILKAMSEAKSSVESKKSTGLRPLIDPENGRPSSSLPSQEAKSSSRSARDRLGRRVEPAKTEPRDDIGRTVARREDAAEKANKKTIAERLGRRVSPELEPTEVTCADKRRTLLQRLGRRVSPSSDTGNGRVSQPEGSLSPRITLSPQRSESLSVSEDSEREVSAYEEEMQTAGRSPSSKFVVTLEGAGASSGRVGIKARLGPRVPLDDDDLPLAEFVEEEEATMEVESNEKRQERCRFWPGCTNGEACSFVHPSQPCRKFPHCSFGDRCVYIHPNCMFDAQCTRPDCPYTHMTRKALPVHKPPPLGKMILSVKPKPPCRFFPNCTNPFCPFTHPKKCRYGANCPTRDTCGFYHPPQRDTAVSSKYKWSKDTVPTEQDVVSASLTEATITPTIVAS